MKHIKSIALITLCLLLIAAMFTGCHKKGEIAIEIGGIQFTSAMYSCALVSADSEARNEFSDQAQTEADFDYYAQTIDEKPYEEWVKDKAVEILSQFAVYKLKSDEAGLTLSDDMKAEIDNYLDYYWSSYQDFLENNGVSKETYKKYMEYSYYAENYFNSIYGKDGTSPVSDADVLAEFNENYRGVYTISITASSEEEVEAAKEKLEGYKKRMLKKTPFSVIYNEYNEISEEDIEHDHAEGESPDDEYVSIVGNDTTDYAVDWFDDIKDMKFGEVSVIESGENVILVSPVDVSGDSYYINQLDSALRHSIKDDDFNADVENAAKALDVVRHASAINRFKVKNIYYPGA